MTVSELIDWLESQPAKDDEVKAAVTSEGQEGFDVQVGECNEMGPVVLYTEEASDGE